MPSSIPWITRGAKDYGEPGIARLKFLPLYRMVLPTCRNVSIRLNKNGRPRFFQSPVRRYPAVVFQAGGNERRASRDMGFSLVV